MHQAVGGRHFVDICADVDEAFVDVATLAKPSVAFADELVCGYASGTHPQPLEKQLITDHIRYSEIVNDCQEAAR